MPAFGGCAVERFGIVPLDAKHLVLRTAVLTIGRLNRATIGPHGVFCEARIGRAAAFVVFHDHLSGDPSASSDDVELTRSTVAGGVVMGIDIAEHVVLLDVQYSSLRKMV